MVQCRALASGGAASQEAVKLAVAEASRVEQAPENLRTMAALMVGADLITTTTENAR
ncbi:hypothetical protein GCM10022225_36000 [Plantactinospora mayteni]|uniref:Uncharacterized protein n=1 Tax=Plantactinospora mayteni TaxID=566021 RepID=A0ABQ4EM23_9ACTN|nr:hypothetical protein Pma05_23620 [Plantactinospora mayteni]